MTDRPPRNYRPHSVLQDAEGDLTTLVEEAATGVRVLVLRAGEIVEDGSPSELMAGSGEYADLHARWAASLG